MPVEPGDVGLVDGRQEVPREELTAVGVAGDLEVEPVRQRRLKALRLVGDENPTAAALLSCSMRCTSRTMSG